MASSTNHCYDVVALHCKGEDSKAGRLGLDVVAAQRMYYKAKNDSKKEREILQLYQSNLNNRCNSDKGIPYMRSFMKSFSVEDSSPDFAFLPERSWFLRLKFKLATPLICKDDETFYLHDNPFHKDKVFKVPFYPASGWKGRLRWVAYKQWVERGGDPEERLALGLLFGAESGEGEGQKLAKYLDDCCSETKDKYRELLLNYYQRDRETVDAEEVTSLPHFAGRLYFYPTFFDKLGVEVINPHSRRTKAGINPIQIETVPAGADGIFQLFFAPTRTVDQKGYSDEELTRELSLVIAAMDEMFRIYGFGAKTSGGFGSVDEINESCLTVNVKNVQRQTSTFIEPKDEFLRYLGTDGVVRPELYGKGENGLLSNSEYREAVKQLSNCGSLNEYQQFRSWYKEFGEAYQKQLMLQESSAQAWFAEAKDFEEFRALPEKLKQDLAQSKRGDPAYA